MQSDEILATVHASFGRRIIGIGALGALSVLLVYIALVQPPAFGWQVFLLALGGLSFWMADQMRRATSLTIELTPDVLRDSEGRILARMADVTRVERGAFAFKPSNGFLVTSSVSAPRVWAPGMWWRVGKRIGVGGMTPGSQTKFMADTMAAMIASRTSDV